MARVGKSRSTVLAVLVAALALVATPAVAPAQGPDEYSLNLPDGGSGEAAPDGSSGGGEPVEETAPVETAPAAPTAPVAPTTEVTDSGEVVVVDDGRKKPKREKPEPVFGSTSLNATIGAQRVPTLKVPEGEERSALVPLGVAGLAGACCLLAVWRLRYRREEPTLPSPPKAAAGEPATKPRPRAKPPRESAAAARVRGDRRRERPAAAKAKSTRRSRPATRGASSS